jgi:hypothetical protein
LTALLVVLGIAAVGGGAVYLNHAHQTKRTAALRATAARLGWSFEAAPDMGVIPGLARFELFDQGRSRKIRNFLAGRRGDLRAAVFDYSYVTGGGNSQATWRQTVLYLQSDAMDLPAFSLRPENLFHRVAGMFGYQDIDVRGRDVFSHRYLLRGPDEGGILRAFTPSVIDFFEGEQRICAAGGGRELLVWRPRTVLKPDGIPQLLQTGLDLLKRFPEAAPSSSPGVG